MEKTDPIAQMEIIKQQITNMLDAVADPDERELGIELLRLHLENLERE